MFGASRTAGVLALVLAGLLAFATATAAADEWTLPPSLEEDTPPPALEMAITSHYEPEIPSKPGKTELAIKLNLLWDVTVTVRAHGAIVPTDEWRGSLSWGKEGDASYSALTETQISTVTWSCKQPGTVYSYVVTAEYFGEQITKSGSFAGASQRQCQEAPRLARRKHREEVLRQQAQAHRRLEEELARDRLYEANCRKVGGKPVTIQTNRGPELVCRSQTGGIVEA